MEIERFWYGELVALNSPSECESCGKQIHRHMYADLDVHGVARWCSVSEWHALHPSS